MFSLGLISCYIWKEIRKCRNENTKPKDCTHIVRNEKDSAIELRKENFFPYIVLCWLKYDMKLTSVWHILNAWDSRKIICYFDTFMPDKQFELIFFFSNRIFLNCTTNKARILSRDLCGLGCCQFVCLFAFSFSFFIFLLNILLV